jgi:hypothetical protein
MHQRWGMSGDFSLYLGQTRNQLDQENSYIPQRRYPNPIQTSGRSRLIAGGQAGQ